MTVWCVICRKALQKSGGLVVCLRTPGERRLLQYGSYLKLHACAGACYEEAERRVVEVLMKETER